MHDIVVARFDFTEFRSFSVTKKGLKMKSKFRLAAENREHFSENCISEGKKEAKY
jgi:hypothetical protein